MQEFDGERFKRLERQVSDIHQAMMGDNYGNEGYKQWRKRVDKFMSKYERMMWLITGGATVVSIGINVIFNIM